MLLNSVPFRFFRLSMNLSLSPMSLKLTSIGLFFSGVAFPSRVHLAIVSPPSDPVTVFMIFFIFSMSMVLRCPSCVTYDDSGLSSILYMMILFLRLSMSMISFAISPLLSPSSSSVDPWAVATSAAVPFDCISSLIIRLMVSSIGLVCSSSSKASRDAFSSSSLCISTRSASRSASFAFDFTCVSSFFTFFSISLKLAAILETSFTMPTAVTLQCLQYHLIPESVLSRRKSYVAGDMSWHLACSHLQHRSHCSAWSVLCTDLLQSGHWKLLSFSSVFVFEVTLCLRFDCRDMLCVFAYLRFRRSTSCV